MSAVTHHVIRILNGQVFESGKLNYSLTGNSSEQALSLYRSLESNYPKFFKMDLLAQWGWLAAELLMRNEVPTPQDPYKRGLVFQNCSASLHADRLYQKSTESIPSPALFVYTLPNIVLGEIAIRHTFKGENTFLVAKQFEASTLAEYARILFETDIIDLLLLGWLECDEASQDILMLRVDQTNYAEYCQTDFLNTCYTEQLVSTPL